MKKIWEFIRIIPWLINLLVGIFILFVWVGGSVSRTSLLFIAYFNLAWALGNMGFWMFNKVMMPKHSGEVQDSILNGNMPLALFYAVVYLTNLWLAAQLFKP